MDILNLLKGLLGFFLVPAVQASFHDFSIPFSSATVSVRAFNVASPGIASGPASGFWAPVLPGHGSFEGPLLAFLIEHAPIQRRGGPGSTESTPTRFMFDLGIRKDPLNFAPAIADLFKEGVFDVGNVTDITERLVTGGIELESIETIMWSHSHFDHIGDMSKFPNTTNLLLGPGTNRVIYPDDPEGVLQASDFAGHNITELSFSNATLSFGGLAAIDYFGDGSFYLLDTPGHLEGHITALARVTPQSFVVLGGDSCHHAGQLRPTPHLQHTFPAPPSLRSSTKTSISTDYFWSHGSQPGIFDLPSRAEPLLTISDVPGTLYADPQKAKVSLEKVQSFDADEDFLVVVAHDASIGDVLELFPETLNDWKEKGWKEEMLWKFMDEGNPAFIFNTKV